MKRLILLFACLFALCGNGNAQQAPPSTYVPQLLSFGGVPTGPCDIYQVALDNTTGNYYPCNPKTRTWVLAGSILGTNNAFTGNNTHSGTETFAGALNGNGGGNLSGTFTGTPIWSGLHTFNAGLTSAGPNTLNGGGAIGGTYTGNPIFSGNVNAGIFTLQAFGALNVGQNAGNGAEVNFFAQASGNFFTGLANGGTTSYNSNLQCLGLSNNNDTASCFARIGAAQTWTGVQTNMPLTTPTITNPTISNGTQSGPLSVSAANALTFNGVPVAGTFTNVNVTPVTTTGGSVTTDQNAMAITITAGSLNSVSRTLLIQLAGVYSTPAASTATLTHKIKLCTVSGCGSGTVLTLASWTSSALGGVQATNNPYNVTINASTQTAGASAAFEVHGNLTIDVAALASAAEAVFADNNTATVGTIDSTAQLFLQHTVAFSAASASNLATDRQMIADTVD